MHKKSNLFIQFFILKIGQSGRVCMNSCFFNKQSSNCNKQNVLKTIVFDPPFDQILPRIHLKLARIDSE